MWWGVVWAIFFLSLFLLLNFRKLKENIICIFNLPEEPACSEASD